MFAPVRGALSMASAPKPLLRLGGEEVQLCVVCVNEVSFFVQAATSAALFQSRMQLPAGFSDGLWGPASLSGAACGHGWWLVPLGTRVGSGGCCWLGSMAVGGIEWA